MKQNYLCMKASFLLISFYLCIFIFLSSCNGGKDSNIPEFRPDTNTTPVDISEGLTVHIYFDATFSMQGFVNPEDPTLYKEVVSNLKSVITVGGWSNEKVKFFKFGTEVDKEDDDNYRMVVTPEFYETEDISQKTFIHEVIKKDYDKRMTPKVINSEEALPTVEDQTAPVKSETVIGDSSKDNHLTIIVTDLFQDRGNINQLVDQIKEKYIDKDLEVGLLGFRSEFKGKVYDYDVRGDEEGILHESKKGEFETYRPFYLLVLGKYADIANYFHYLITRVEYLIERGYEKAETIIFSRYLVDPLISFNKSKIEQRDNLNEDHDNKDYSASQKRLFQQYSVLQYAVLEELDVVELTATSEYAPTQHAMFFDSEKLAIDVVAKYSDTEKQDKESRSAGECLQVTPQFSELKDKLTVKFRFAPECLPADESIYYLYEVTLRPKIDGYEVPEWCSKWDMNLGREGSKTLNLVNFVRDLSQITVHKHKPEIAKYYFYIKNK